MSKFKMSQRKKKDFRQLRRKPDEVRNHASYARDTAYNIQIHDLKFMLRLGGGVVYDDFMLNSVQSEMKKHDKIAIENLHLMTGPNPGKAVEYLTCKCINLGHLILNTITGMGFTLTAVK